MIIISNSQREQILRYLDLLCKHMQGEDNRTYNTRRMARNLAKKLRAKESVPAELLRRNNRQDER